MKVLVIDEWLPWPLDSGKKIRSYNLIKQLSTLHEITYIAYVDVNTEHHKISEMAKYCKDVISVVDKRRKKWSLLYYFDVFLNLLSKKAFSTHYHVTDYFRYELIKVINDIQPDIIHCEWTNLAPLLDCVHNIPIAISAHNIESDIWERIHLNSNNPLVKYIGYQQTTKIMKLEKEWYRKANICIAVSSRDKEVIKSYGANADVVENGVDISYYKNIQNDYIELNSIAFTASFDTFSNQDAVKYFMSDIYPIIKQKNGSIKVYFIGKDPPNFIRKLSKNESNVTFTGTLCDIRYVLSKISVSIVPLRIGGGSRLKILESMAMKKPIVSTSIGAEGINVTHGSNILLADSPQDFADYVVSLVEDIKMQQQIAESGYEFVVNNYSWDVLAKKQNNIWSNLITR